jgi:hypothetical protein
MQLTIQNVSTQALFFSDLYATIQPGATLSTTRQQSDLSNMVSLQNAIAAGQVVVTVTPTAAEIASGLLGVETSPAIDLTVAEFDNPLAAATNNMMAATASSASAVVLNPAAAAATGVLTQATITNLGAAARQLVFTTAGATPANQPATAVISGLDVRGRPLTETVYPPNVAGTYTSVNFWSSITNITLAAGGGTGATLAIGLGSKIGLAQLPHVRAGRVAVVQEISGGSVVTNGTVAVPTTQTEATVTGTGDLTVGATITSLNTTTLQLAVDHGAVKTVTFAAPANELAVIAQINAVFPGLAAEGGTGNKYVVLASAQSVAASGSVQVVGGTSLTLLGLTAAFTQGVGNGEYGSYTPNAAPNGATSYAITYEYAQAA